MDFNNLTKGEEFIVEWRYGMLGDFKTALIRVIARADIHNQAKLALGFPDEVKAYQQYTQKDEWWNKVLIKAGIKKGGDEIERL